MVVRSYVRLNLFLRLPKQNIRELDRGPVALVLRLSDSDARIESSSPGADRLSLVNPQSRQAINDQSCGRSQPTLGSGRIAGSMFGP